MFSFVGMARTKRQKINGNTLVDQPEDIAENQIHIEEPNSTGTSLISHAKFCSSFLRSSLKISILLVLLVMKFTGVIFHGCR